MKKLQFETEDANLGLTKALGFAWASDTGVFIEYQVSDSIIGVKKWPVAETFIPFDEIVEVLYKSGWFSGGEVSIQLNSLKNVENLPFLEDATLTLSLNRKQKEHGKEFAKTTNHKRSKYDLEHRER